ncbi:hypothetical protein [Streptomyces hebeiensis]
MTSREKAEKATQQYLETVRANKAKADQNGGDPVINRDVTDAERLVAAFKRATGL